MLTFWQLAWVNERSRKARGRKKRRKVGKALTKTKNIVESCCDSTEKAKFQLMRGRAVGIDKTIKRLKKNKRVVVGNTSYTSYNLLPLHASVNITDLQFQSRMLGSA